MSLESATSACSGLPRSRARESRVMKKAPTIVIPIPQRGRGICCSLIEAEQKADPSPCSLRLCSGTPSRVEASGTVSKVEPSG